MWEIRQYPRVIASFRSRATPELWDEMLISLAMLREKGNECRRPVSAPLEDGIFELRARAGTIQGRLLYYFSTERRRLIVVAHELVKKTKRIDPHDIATAQKRRSEIQRGDVEHVDTDRTH